MSASSLLPGQIVAGRYAVQSALGGRGTTTTYHAITVPNRHVAVKLWNPALLARQDVVAAVRRAEVVVSSLPQATVLEVVDSGCDGPSGAPYSVTDLSDHPSLAQLVELCPLTEGEMLSMLQGVAQAVDAAREAGIAHLSLKPTNVFVGPPPMARIRVADFGTAPARGALDPAGFDRASAPWLAPEQASPGGAGGPASDVFTSALVAFFAMTGRSYWRACREEPFDEGAWRSELGGPRVAVSAEAGELGVSLGGALDEVFERALAIDPAQRFASVGEFAAAVGEALGAPPSESTAIARALPVAAVAAAAVPPPPAWLAAPIATPPQVDGAAAMGPPSPPAPVARMPSPAPVPPPAPMPRAPAQPAPMLAPPAFASSAAEPPTSVSAPTADPAAWFADVAVPAQAPASPAEQVPISRELGAPPPYAPPPAARSQTPTERPPRMARRGVAIAVVASGALVLIAGIPLALKLGAASGAAASSATAVEAPTSAAPPPTVAAAPPEQPTAAPSATAAGAAAPADAGAAAPADGDAELTVHCAPECDGVLVKGRLTEAGKPQRLPPGDYVVTGVKARHRTQSRVVTLTPGGSETVSFVLVPKACGKFLKRCD